MPRRDMTFRLFGQDVSASKAVRGVGRESAMAGKQIHEHLGTKGVAAGVAMGGALVYAGEKAVEFGKTSVEAYVHAQDSQERLEYAFKKFPLLANTNIDALRKINMEIEKRTGLDHNALASGQAVLAQFKLSGQEIATITPLVADYAAKTGKDVPTAAALLGRAFLGNSRALKTVGIEFKSTGDHTRDFDSIMGKLRQKVGGFATQEGKTAEGQARILGTEFRDVEQSVGQQLLPALMHLAHFILGDVVPAIKDSVQWLKQNKDIVIPLVSALVAGIAAWKTYTAVAKGVAIVQALINGEMEANPIGIVVTAIAALVAGMIMAYKHSATFRAIVQGAFHGIEHAAHAVVGFFTGPFLHAIGMLVATFVKGAKFMVDIWFDEVGLILHGAEKMLGWVPGIGGKLKHAVAAFDAFRQGVDAKFSQIASDAESWGEKTGKGLAEGIHVGIEVNKAKALVSAGKLGAQVASEAARAAGVRSPSTKTIYVGKMLVEGLLHGWSSAMSRLLSKLPADMQRLLNALQAKMQAAMDRSQQAVDRAKQNLKNVLDQRRQLAQQLAQSTADSAGITGAIDQTTGQVGDVGAFLSTNVSKLKTFARDIAMLRKRGLAPALLAQIANAGPDDGIKLAEALLSGSSGSFASLNASQAAIQRYAGQVGNVTAGAVYAREVAHDRHVLRETLAEQKRQTRILELIAAKIQGRITAKELQAELLKLKRANGGKALGLS